MSDKPIIEEMKEEEESFKNAEKKKTKEVTHKPSHTQHPEQCS